MEILFSSGKRQGILKSDVCGSHVVDVIFIIDFLVYHLRREDITLDKSFRVSY